MSIAISMEENTTPKDRMLRASVLVGITVLGAFLRIFHIGSKSIWLDEAYSVLHALKGSLSELFISSIFGDRTPPLYYVLLHYWIKAFGGQSEAMIRLPSAIFGILSIPLMYVLVKNLFGKSTALIAALLVATSPFLNFYAQEVRSYSLFVLITMLSVIFFLKYIKEEKWLHWVLYVVSTSFLLYTNYFSILLILAQNLFVVYKWRVYKPIILKWLSGQLVIFLLFLPWIVVVLSNMGVGDILGVPISGSAHYDWFNPKGALMFAWQSFYAFSGGVVTSMTYEPVWKLILVPILFLPLFFAGVFKLKASKDVFAFILLHIFVPTVISFSFVFFLSYLLPRHIIQVSLFYIMILAFYLSTIKNKIMLTSLLVLVCGFGLSSQYNYYFNPMYQVEDCKGAAKYVISNMQRHDILIVNAGFMILPLDYYLRGKVEMYGLMKEDMPQKIETATQGHNRVWVVFSHTNEARGRESVEDWMQQYYRRIDEKRLKGVEVFLYRR